jgi:predicted transcriptional regulator
MSKSIMCIKCGDGISLDMEPGILYCYKSCECGGLIIEATADFAQKHNYH